MISNCLPINDITNIFILVCLKNDAIDKKSNQFFLDSVNILFYLQLDKVRRLLKVCVGAISSHFLTKTIHV